MRQIHIRCGSDIGESLFEAGYEGDFLEWADPVCAGPVSAADDLSSYLSNRAAFISRSWGYDYQESYDRLEREYLALDTLGNYERITLWFEHDLYDQSVLCNLLSRLISHPEILQKCALISTDRYEGIDPFIGFGQLSPDQLASFRDMSLPVTAQMAAHAARFWDAYRADDPAELVRLYQSEGVEGLPYLHGAMHRFLQEYPASDNGLSLTQHICLRALKDGAETPGQVFRDLMMSLDPQPYLGDVMFWPILHELSHAPQPAITDFEDFRDPVALTDYGRSLLAGEVDWLADNPVDCWRGGVHLKAGNIWRWDEAQGRLQR